MACEYTSKSRPKLEIRDTLIITSTHLKVPMLNFQQARAPNSPVIIVGTHYDMVSEKFPPGYLDYLQTKIRDKFIYISDPEKRGLPRVMYSVEVI